MTTKTLLLRAAKMISMLRRCDHADAASLELELRNADKHGERRAPQPAPTAPGWYYGRVATHRVSADKIEPRLVALFNDRLVVLRSDVPGLAGAELDTYTWFGPVPSIQEATP